MLIKTRRHSSFPTSMITFAMVYSETIIWIDVFVADRFYITLFSALEQIHCSRVWFYMSDQVFIARFWISTEVVYLQRWHGWCHMKLLPFRRALCTPYDHALCHIMQSHIHKVHFWQNDRDLFCATAVTRRWNGYRIRNKLKLTLKKRNSPALRQGFEPLAF